MSKNSEKPESPGEPKQVTSDVFELSDDFESRLAHEAGTPNRVTPPPMPVFTPQELTPVKARVVFDDIFSEATVDGLMGYGKPQETPRPASAKPGNVSVADPEKTQYQFYEKRLDEVLHSFPDDTLENSIRLSAAVILYVLSEFQYTIDPEKRDKIIAKMEKLVGAAKLPGETSGAKVRTPFRGEALRLKVESIYKHHTRRYTQLRTEFKAQRAAEALRREEMEAEEQRQADECRQAEERLQSQARQDEERRKLEQRQQEDGRLAAERRQEKERRLAERNTLVSADELRRMEAELDSMMLETAISHGIRAATVLNFGMEETTASVAPAPPTPMASMPPPAMQQEAPLVAPERDASKEKLSPQEIIARNNERRRQRGLLKTQDGS